MNKFFAVKKSFSVAVVLAGLAGAGSVSAFAQSAGTTGSVLPWHYTGDGGRAPGWSPQDAEVRQLAYAQPSKKSGLSAFAQVPTMIQPLVPDYSATVPSSLGQADRFGAASQR